MQRANSTRSSKSVLKLHQGRTAETELCFAVIDAMPEKVKLLIEGGVDVDAEGDRRAAAVAGRTPIWLATQAAARESSDSWKDFTDAISEIVPSIPKRDHELKRENFIQIIKLLIQAGANLDKRSSGSTPLAIAVRRRDIEVVSLLLASGASASAKSFSILSKLVKKKGGVGTMGYYNTVLHTAVEQKSIPIVRLLLSAGADPNKQDHKGNTPLDLARKIKQDALVKLLSGGQKGS